MGKSTILEGLLKNAKNITFDSTGKENGRGLEKHKMNCLFLCRRREVRHNSATHCDSLFGRAVLGYVQENGPLHVQGTNSGIFWYFGTFISCATLILCFLSQHLSRGENVEGKINGSAEAMQYKWTIISSNDRWEPLFKFTRFTFLEPVVFSGSFPTRTTECGIRVLNLHETRPWDAKTTRTH